MDTDSSDPLVGTTHNNAGREEGGSYLGSSISSRVSATNYCLVMDVDIEKIQTTYNQQLIRAAANNL